MEDADVVTNLTHIEQMRLEIVLSAKIKPFFMEK